MPEKKEVIHTAIWQELPTPDDPYAAETCYCRGFDVYGDLLRHASYVDYLYLLFKGEPPTAPQRRLLELLAMGLANPGPRDHSVRAAMNAGVIGAPAASMLMASLAVGAGGLGGGQDVARTVLRWQALGTDLDAWQRDIQTPPEPAHDIWPDCEHPAGFDPNSDRCAPAHEHFLQRLCEASARGPLVWLSQHRPQLEHVANCGLSISGIAATACHELGLSHPAAEMLYLLLRLPGAAVHALEQQRQGWRRYPFFGQEFQLEAPDS